MKNEFINQIFVGVGIVTAFASAIAIFLYILLI